METYSLRVRAQLLYPLNGVIAAMWKYQYARNVRRLHGKAIVRLRSHAYRRLNAHEGLIDFVYDVITATTTTATVDDDRIERITIKFQDAELQTINDSNEHTIERTNRENDRLAYLERLLLLPSNNDNNGNNDKNDIKNDQRNDDDDNNKRENEIFWQPDEWWRERLLANKDKQRWWKFDDNSDNNGDEDNDDNGDKDDDDNNGDKNGGNDNNNNNNVDDKYNNGINTDRHSFKRTCRLLNHTVRRLTNEHGIESTEAAIRLLMNANDRQCRMMNKLYVEPTMTSLFVAYLSTTFMHHKQQHGLNTKHAAATSVTSPTSLGAESTSSSSSSAATMATSSERPFDAKIYLDMCSSCDKKDIFELMLSLDRSRNHREFPCRCSLCDNLCQMANAWRFYDCTDRAWLRLEFNRKFYNKVSNTLNEVIPTDSDSLRIVYLSYKNEFTDRTNFISNFVNYYAFYENGEQPVSKFDNNRALREKISILFVFALINWQLIAKAMEINTAYNSISLNQQSIFKSLDNTLYAIFSENSINRMSKEKQQRLLNINAPYVNRGFGALPNSGVNAITTTVTR